VKGKKRHGASAHDVELLNFSRLAGPGMPPAVWQVCRAEAPNRRCRQVACQLVIIVTMITIIIITRPERRWRRGC